MVQRVRPGLIFAKILHPRMSFITQRKIIGAWVISCLPCWFPMTYPQINTLPLITLCQSTSHHKPRLFNAHFFSRSTGIGELADNWQIIHCHYCSVWQRLGWTRFTAEKCFVTFVSHIPQLWIVKWNVSYLAVPHRWLPSQGLWD